MYDFLLVCHSYLRWLVVLVGLLVLIGSCIAWRQSRSLWLGGVLDTAYIALLHTQLVLGLGLYFIFSPKVRAVLSGSVEDWMGISALRKLVLEHPILMLMAVLVAQITRLRTKRISYPVRRHKVATWGYGISLLLLLLGIPW